jgi:hypothetical protein
MEISLDQNGNPILNQFSEEGFVDCVFKISSIEESESHYFFNLKASFNAQIVGFNVKLYKYIENGFDAEMNGYKDRFYSKGVTFYSSGEESDLLITEIADLYGLELGQLEMVKEESFTVFALMQKRVDFNSEAARLKLFGRDQDHNESSEHYQFFFNIDLPMGLVFWNEKDQAYRNPLVSALSKSKA